MGLHLGQLPVLDRLGPGLLRPALLLPVGGDVGVGHDPVHPGPQVRSGGEPVACPEGDRKSTRLNSSHVAISYAVFCLKKKKSMQEAVRTGQTKTDMSALGTTEVTSLWHTARRWRSTQTDS